MRCMIYILCLPPVLSPGAKDGKTTDMDDHLFHQHLYHTYYVSGTILNASQIRTYLIITTAQVRHPEFFCFTHRELRHGNVSYKICSRSNSTSKWYSWDLNPLLIIWATKSQRDYCNFLLYFLYFHIFPAMRIYYFYTNEKLKCHFYFEVSNQKK